MPLNTPAVPAVPESVRLSVTEGPLNVGLLPPLTVRKPSPAVGHGHAGVLAVAAGRGERDALGVARLPTWTRPKLAEVEVTTRLSTTVPVTLMEIGAWALPWPAPALLGPLPEPSSPLFCTWTVPL